MHHRFTHFFGRHPHGSRGHSPFGHGFMDGLGGRGFGMGRKLTSVDLQLLILALLADKPQHGYEIIKLLDERTKGFYVPSPGMVYPALTYLEEIGHATVEAAGTRKLYHITEAGKQHLDEHRDRAESLLGQFERVGERMDRLRRAMHAEETGEADSEDRRSHERRGSRELLRARHDLKAALADKWDSPRAEQQRMVEILKRATKEILGQ